MAGIAMCTIIINVIVCVRSRHFHQIVDDPRLGSDRWYTGAVGHVRDLFELQSQLTLSNVQFSWYYRKARKVILCLLWVQRQ